MGHSLQPQSPCEFVQLPRWIPLSIMNGGGPANTLVRSLDSGWGRALFSNILIRNIAQSLYKVRAIQLDVSTIILRAAKCCWSANADGSQRCQRKKANLDGDLLAVASCRTSRHWNGHADRICQN